MENTKSFTAGEAETLVRFFARLEQQLCIAADQGRQRDACKIAGLIGKLRVRCFMVNDAGSYTGANSMFEDGRYEDEEAPEPEPEPEEEYRGPDMDAAYDRMVEEEMGCD
jgi:hypothetical protein